MPAVAGSRTSRGIQLESKWTTSTRQHTLKKEECNKTGDGGGDTHDADEPQPKTADETEFEADLSAYRARRIR